MHPLLLKIGPLTLHTYGLMVALGFLAAFFWAKWEFNYRGLPVDFLEHNILMLMLSAILGARFFYFSVNRFQGFLSDPWSFFRVWEGGLVFYGGFLFAAAFLLYQTHRWEIPFLRILDALAGPLLLGQAFGRLGCFAAGCCYGRPTDLPWGVTFTDPDSLAPLLISLHPTQLYSALLDLLLLGGMLLLRSRIFKRGFTIAYYLVGYGVTRFLIEFIRGDDRGVVVFHFQPSQWISLVMIVTGVLIVSYGKRHADR